MCATSYMCVSYLHQSQINIVYACNSTCLAVRDNIEDNIEGREEKPEDKFPTQFSC